MEKYIYLIVGIVLGGLIVLYYYLDREERITKTILSNQKVYSTKKLNAAMQTVVDRIRIKKNEVKRDLTEEEKDDIVIQSYKDTFKI